MKNKQGQLYQLDDSGRIRAEYTNTSTGEHHCMPFASEEGATAWLTSKGVAYKDIDRIQEDDLEIGSQPEIENVLSKALKSMDHSLNAVSRVQGMMPKAGYNIETMAQFQEDAVTNMVILAKCGLPVHPEDLEDYLQSHLAGRGAKS